jgi:hypothetical protein
MKLNSRSAGGIGEVYRSRDTMLNHDAAVETAPDS